MNISFEIFVVFSDFHKEIILPPWFLSTLGSAGSSSLNTLRLDYNERVITSTRNPKIQEIRALQRRARQRRELGAFVVEGVRLAEEALAAGWPVQLALYSPQLSARGMELVAQMEQAGVEVEPVSVEVMAAASDTKTPQGLLLQLAFQTLPPPAQPTLALILDQIRDPGNLGTLLRSAAACAADLALLTPGCADPFAPKVLRGGMGAQFHLPVLVATWEEIAAQCQQHGLNVLLAEAGQGELYTQTDLRQAVAFVVGGEASGPGKEAHRLVHGSIQIPMPGNMESLNAAVAGSLLLFEALRQRRNKGVQA